MNMAAVIHEKGALEVFRWEEWPVGEPGPGEVRLRHGAIEERRTTGSTVLMPFE